MQRLIIAIFLLAVPLAAVLPAAPLITYQLTTIGAGQYQYDYSFTGLSFQNNQELDIDFDANLYGPISNGIAPAGYDLLLFQPNVPAGSTGEYSLLATIDNPATVGTFSVQFTYLGTGTPSFQPFEIYDDNGPSILLTSGVTVASASPEVPEPSGFWLCNIGMILITCMGVAKRRRARQAVSRTTA